MPSYQNSQLVAFCGFIDILRIFADRLPVQPNHDSASAWIIDATCSQHPRQVRAEIQRAILLDIERRVTEARSKLEEECGNVTAYCIQLLKSSLRSALAAIIKPTDQLTDIDFVVFDKVSNFYAESRKPTWEN